MAAPAVSDGKKRKAPLELSSASVVDLKAELAKQQAAFNREKTTASLTSAAARRPAKKSSVWQKKNAGVEARNRSDQAERRPDPLDWDAHRKILEKKARLYEKLLREGDESLSEKEKEEMLIDFDQKILEEDEPVEVETGPAEDEDDPWVEYTDEFGRVRVTRRSQLPQEELPSTRSDGEQLPEMMSEDMRRDMERQRWEAEAQAEIERGPQHYDSTKEVRTKGVGFYKFSTVEEERMAQMKELKAIRQKTEMQRALFRSVKDRRKELADARLSAIRAKIAKAKGTAALTPPEEKIPASKDEETEAEKSNETVDVLGTARITSERSITASEEEVKRHEAIASFLSSF